MRLRLVSGAEIAPAPRASAFGSPHSLRDATRMPVIFSRRILRLICFRRWKKKIRDRKERHKMQCELALREFDRWYESVGVAAV